MPADAVPYYWRPGCPFSSMLRRNLERVGIGTVGHDIRPHPDGAAIVRFHADGNETVPIVVAGLAR